VRRIDSSSDFFVYICNISDKISDPMKQWLECMRNYVVFRGRARRQEFWMFVLFNTFVCGILLAGCCTAAYLLFCRQSAEGADATMAALTVCGFGLLVYVWMLVTLLPGLAVRVRRLHDIGLSGKWLLGYYAFHAVCLQWLLASILRFCEDGASTAEVPAVAALWLRIRPTVAAMAIMTAAGIAAMCVGSEKGANRYGADPRTEDAAVSSDESNCLT